MFRRAVSYQERHDYHAAHEAYQKASELSLGNVRLAVYRASLYELEGKYKDAAQLYDAVHCLWKKNIEILYRSAAARVNRAQELLAHHGKAAKRLAVDGQTGTSGPQMGSSASAGPALLHEGLQLIEEAQGILCQVRKDLRFWRVLWMWFKTLLPRRRDIGERRYWGAWLHRDDFRQPLMLLRRSKRHEYVSAVKATRKANEMLAFLIESEDRPQTPELDVERSFKSVNRLIRKKRIGWLAHWTAACYFSCAAEAADLAAPKNWRKYERRSRKRGSLGFPMGRKIESWQEYCEEMAIGEIGRVLRNPCNQLNPELLRKDPDMKRLHKALKGAQVRVLIDPLPDSK